MNQDAEKCTVSDHVEAPLGHTGVPDNAPAKWPLWRRNLLYSAICLTSFASINSVLANALGLVIQADGYGINPETLTYSLSAGLAGNALGPLLWQPIAVRFGKASSIFWASLMLLGFNIWAARCTAADDYGQFIASRAMGGVAGSASGFLSGAIIIEIYDLKNRGKAFTLWSFSMVFGTQIAPLMSGYIVFYSTWPVQYWSNVGLDGLVAALLFAFLEETEESADGKHVDLQSETWLQRRRYLVPGMGLPRSRSVLSGIGQMLTVSGKILLCPHALIACFGLFTYFGFAAGINNVISVLLQTPRAFGGYGLNAEENSRFLFSSWVGVFIALAYGILVTDRLPLYLCRRNGGVWKPEYRLSPLWLPCLVLFPLGYLLLGLALERHWTAVVVGLASVLVASAAVMILSPLLSYLTECFMRHGSEANILGNVARLAWGISLPFFVFPWVEAVGLGWTFGMTALFNIVCFTPIVALSFYGDTIRKFSVKSVSSAETGIVVETLH